MHERNQLKNNPDFLLLSKLQPALQSHLFHVQKDHYTINFKEPAALNALTCALAKQYYDVVFELPVVRLIPTLPLRLNYLHWLEDIISYSGQLDNVTGIDIGTGASAVYAILGSKTFGWSFVGTESDKLCYESALLNVQLNELEHKISVKLVENDRKKLIGNIGSAQYTFCMCNPPFFEDVESMTGCSRTGHRAKPKSICTAVPNEVITAGGEEEFVGGIVGESVELQNQLLWYTSMLGRKTSVHYILKLLSCHGISKVAVTEFKQGNTTRWGVAWSLSSSIPLLLLPHPKAKFATTYSFTCTNATLGSIAESILKTAADLKVTVRSCGIPDKCWYWLTAAANSWSHYRRKRRKLTHDTASDATAASDATPASDATAASDATSPLPNSTTSPRARQVSVTSKDNTCLFHCFLCLSADSDNDPTDMSPDIISVDFHWIFGADKDSLNQFCCYVAKCVGKVS